MRRPQAPLVHEGIYDAVFEELTAVASAMPMGNGLDENNVLGPLQNKAQYDVVASLVEAVRDSGARILLGGDPDIDEPVTSTHHPGSGHR